jgi:phenylacetyl-CoA:acceptor oxidoreductase subunit 1
MVRWGMVIDLRTCIGCGACEIACRHTNKLALNYWRQVIDCGVSAPPERQRTYLPINCVHCSEPPCLEVCPTTATYRRPDGVVAVDYELCIGCGYCIVACPYLARTIILRNEYGFAVGHRPQEPGMAAPDPRYAGVCTKCNFCLPRVDEGLAQGLRPGLDPEATPACVVICSTNTLHFGDLEDPNSEVSRLIQENKTARLQEGLGTDPSVYYIVE